VDIGRIAIRICLAKRREPPRPKSPPLMDTGSGGDNDRQHRELNLDKCPF